MLGNSRFLYRAQAFVKVLFSYPRRLASKTACTAILIDSEVDKDAAIDAHVRFYRSKIGRCSYVGRGSYLESVEIGSFCSIGGDCNIGGGSHPMDGISTSPVFCSGQNILKTNLCRREFNPFSKTIIENDVWIANGAKIKGGVRISTGAVVGMGAIVTKDVGPYEVWAGNPARMIKKRFDEKTIGELLDSRWWELSNSELSAACSDGPGVCPELIERLSELQMGKRNKED